MNTCVNCSQDFEISDFESEFHRKIEVFSPTHCPTCRMQRRVAQRNESKFYKRTCDGTQKDIISLYHQDSPYTIYEIGHWFSDAWDGTQYGQSFDFNRPFFEQFYELSLKVPKPNLTQVNNENSPYTTGTGYCKNCHMINSSEYCEDCLYGKLLQTCTDIMDCSYVYDSELCYECFNVRNCYNCIHVYNSQNATDCLFSDDLNGCSHCCLCTNLSQKKYHFLNKPLEKEEYTKRVAELQSYSTIRKTLQSLSDLRMKRICKYANIVNSENSSGDFIRNCKNCKDCYDMNDSEDCMYVQVGVKTKNLLDCSNMYIDPEFCYEVMSTIGIHNVHFSTHIFHSNDIWYSDHCHNCHDLFGCSGLRNRQYCIFNTQYTKEEYVSLRGKIMEHMKERNEWGEFFPIQYSPFAYNETLAYEYMPMLKNDVIAKGWNWRDEEGSGFPETIQKIAAQKLPDRIDHTPDDILNWAIECEETDRLFKIQKAELQFYRKLHLPVAHFHPDVRHMHRMDLRNARKLYSRNCMKCGASIQSAYASDRPEIVYCETCYLEEVY